MALLKVPSADTRCRVGALFRAPARRIGVAAMVLLCAPILVSAVNGQGLSPRDTLNRLTAEDIAGTLILLTSFTNDPGVGGATLNVNTDGGQEKLTYSKANIRIDEDFLHESDHGL